MEDLKTIRSVWGGHVPIGLRNTWLHIYAAALSHCVQPSEIPHLVAKMAASATPGLGAREVDGLAEAAKARAQAGSGCIPTLDTRYHYSGERIADLLGVSDEMARSSI